MGQPLAAPECNCGRDDGWHLAKCRSLNAPSLVYRMLGTYAVYQNK